LLASNDYTDTQTKSISRHTMTNKCSYTDDDTESKPSPFYHHWRRGWYNQ